MTTDNPQAPDFFLPWAAGLFDGEGCIHLAKSKPSATNVTVYSIRMTVKMVHKPTIDRLHCYFKVGKVHRVKPGKNNARVLWQWLCCGKEAGAVLAQLAPFLFVKLPEAIVTLEYLRSNPNARRHPVCDYPAIVKRREECYLKMRELKGFNWS